MEFEFIKTFTIIGVERIKEVLQIFHRDLLSDHLFDGVKGFCAIQLPFWCLIRHYLDQSSESKTATFRQTDNSIHIFSPSAVSVSDLRKIWWHHSWRVLLSVILCKLFDWWLVFERYLALWNTFRSYKSHAAPKIEARDRCLRASATHLASQFSFPAAAAISSQSAPSPRPVPASP